LDLFRDIRHRNPHVLVAVHRCAKVKFFNVDAHESSIGGGDDGAKEEVSCVDLSHFSGCRAGVIEAVTATMKRMQFGSSFWDQKAETIRRYAAFRSAGLSSGWMKWMMLVPSATSSKPWTRRPISFAYAANQSSVSFSIFRYRHSWAMPISVHMTEFAEK